MRDTWSEGSPVELATWPALALPMATSKSRTSWCSGPMARPWLEQTPSAFWPWHPSWPTSTTLLAAHPMVCALYKKFYHYLIFIFPSQDQLCATIPDVLTRQRHPRVGKLVRTPMTWYRPMSTLWVQFCCHFWPVVTHSIHLNSSATLCKDPYWYHDTHKNTVTIKAMNWHHSSNGQQCADSSSPAIRPTAERLTIGQSCDRPSDSDYYSAISRSSMV